MGFKKTAPILKWEKQDDGGLRFEAVFSSEAPDTQGDIVLQSATQKAVERWKAKNLREMHEPIAIGKAIDFDFMADGTSCMTGFVTAGAPLTVKKVEDKVLQMLSIAGPSPTKTSRKSIGGKVYRVIEEYDLTEISLVDNGANPDAWISVTKAAGLESEGEQMQKNETEAPLSDVATPPAEYEKAAEPPCEIPGHAEMTPEEHAKAHEEKPAEEKAAVPEVKKYDGMAVYDVRLALDCLAMLEELMLRESGEAGMGKPEPPRQLKALAASCIALKEFVASEAQELLEPNGKAQRGLVVIKFDTPAPQEIDLDALAAKVSALIPIQKSAPVSEPDARIDTLQKTVDEIKAGSGDLKVIRDGVEKMLAQPVPGRAPVRFDNPEALAKSVSNVDQRIRILEDLAASADAVARPAIERELAFARARSGVR
jgi:hypothetical protein